MARLKESDLEHLYRKAKSCKRCTDTADSFGNYVSTYCHYNQIHLVFQPVGGEKITDKLNECRGCKFYESRLKGDGK